LIGYRCSGKTSIGKGLAGRLGLPFVDTDELVEKRVGKTIREMVGASGWAFFRRQEREAIKSLAALDQSIIATGGGAVMAEDNAADLKQEGVLIWLVADEETVLKRMLADAATAEQRPSLSGADLKKEISETLALRTPVYRRLADYAVYTGRAGIEESVERIVEFLLSRTGGLPVPPAGCAPERRK